MILSALLVLIIVAAITAATILLRHNAVIIVHKEDQAVPTILQRLDALEKTTASLPDNVAEADAVNALGKRVDTIEAEIGSEPSDNTAAMPTPATDQTNAAVPLGQATFG